MQIRKLNIIYLLIVAFVISFVSCDDSGEGKSIYPPDYVDPDDDNGDEEEVIDDDLGPVYEAYNFPQIDADGRIIVAGRPPQYTDTAKYHVVSVGYDLTSNSEMDLTDYYSSAVGLKGEALREAIFEIVSDNFKGISYGEIRYSLQESDVDPLDETQVWCFYKEMTHSIEWVGQGTWNREHVWARSKGLGDVNNSTTSQASDMHNLKPEDEAVNTEKSNYDFTEDANDADYAGKVGTAGYAPAKSARGDVARILMYMEIRYNEEHGLKLDDNVSQAHSPRHGRLSDLLKWHNQDPVDPYEVRRNNVIYKYQKNRNPFIDHPELVEYIWGEYQNVKWDGGVVYEKN